MNKSWDWFTVIGGHLNFGLFQDGNIGENIERDFKELKNPSIAKERKERWRSPSGLSCHFMLLNRILLHKMTPHFVVLIGCIKSPWPIDLRRRNSAGSCKVASTDAFSNKNWFFIWRGGGGASAHRLVQSGMFVEYVHGLDEFFAIPHFHWNVRWQIELYLIFHGLAVRNPIFAFAKTDELPNLFPGRMSLLQHCLFSVQIRLSFILHLPGRVKKVMGSWFVSSLLKQEA